MLNIEVCKLRESEVLSVIGEYANYYHETDESYPVIEVFCLGGESQVLKNVAELNVAIDLKDSKASVDYERFSSRYYRIMVLVDKDVPLYQVLAYAKILSEYGYNEYLDLPYSIGSIEYKYTPLERQLMILKHMMNKLGWNDCGYDKEYEPCDKRFKGVLEFFREKDGYTQITQVYLSKEGYEFGVDYRVSYEGEELVADGETINSYNMQLVVSHSIGEYENMINNIIGQE